jgi:UDP-glucose 4-epimerase
MKTYLVTGAAGFIGGALAKRLIDKGNKVVTIDNLTTGYEDAIPSGVIFYKGDCQDYKIVQQLEKYSFEAIFHIAGQSSGEISFDNPVYDLQTNTQSTLLLLKLALTIGCKKFIYASTMSIYGDQPEEAVKETALPTPKSFYGVGKLASEHYLRIYQEYGIQCTALRLFNVYGPGQNLKNLRQGMVSIFIAQAINNKHIHIKGSRRRFRDFVFIDDVVDAFFVSLRNNIDFQVLNICTQTKTSIETLVNLIKSHFDENVTDEYSGSTPGDQFGIVGDWGKAKAILAWEPEIDLEMGMKSMINWAVNNNK